MLLVAALLVVSFVTSEYVVLLSLLGVVLVGVYGARISVSYCFKVLKIPAIFILILIVVNGFLMTGETTLVGVGAFNLTDVNLIQNGLAFLRLTVVILAVVILMRTTKSYEFSLAMASFLSPLTRMGVKTGGFLLILKMVSRFIPTLSLEAKRILSAQASRGLDIKTASISRKIKLITALLVPVFVISIKRADQLTDAMLVRGYVLNGKRTSYRTLKNEEGLK